MKQQVKYVFVEIRNAIEIYQTAVRSVLQAYASAYEEAKQESERYKDADRELAARKAALVKPARERIVAADEKLHDLLTESAKKLRDELSAHVAARPDENYVANLRNIKDFGLVLSKVETEQLLTAAKGNYTALRMLQSVAGESGWKIQFQSVADFEKDLKKIELASWTPCLWADDKHLNAALDVLPDAQQHREDGSVAYSIGRPTVPYVMVGTARLNSLKGEIAKMSERWQASIVPTVQEKAPESDGDTESSEAAEA